MKRIFALALMALVLCLPVWAMADDNTGYCGDPNLNDVRWSYDSDTKVFTISGNGAIGGYAFYSSGIWNNAEKLVIENGITAIESYVFAGVSYDNTVGFRNMKSVSLPESLTIIGESAFSGCSSLTSVNVPCSWHKNPLYDFGDSVTLDFPSEWTVTKPATTTETGMEQRVCTACGHIFETREILKLPELPTTGDESNVILWSALACISLFGMMTLVRMKKEA